MLEPAESFEDALERLQTVAESCCFLVAEAFAQVIEPLPKAGQGPVHEELIELLRRRSCKRPGGERSLSAAADRAELRRGVGDDELVASASQIDAPVLVSTAGVGGRLKLPDQPELLERRLELGAEDAPLDLFERQQGRLHRRALRLSPWK